MANGLAGLQPFPQFAPGGEGGLIPSLQMPASNVSAMFPRTSGGGGGRRKLSAGEKFAGLAPFAIEGIASLFGKDEPIKTAEDFYASIRPPETAPREPTDLERARYNMYLQLGEEPSQQEGFDWKEFVPHLVGAVATGEGAPAYGKTYAAMKTGERTAERATEVQRAAGIAKYLEKINPKNLTFVDLVDYRKRGYQPDNIVKGFMTGSEINPQYMLETFDKKGYIDSTSEAALYYRKDQKEKSDWVPIDTIADLKEIPTGVDAAMGKDLVDWQKEFHTRETSLLNLYKTAASGMEILNSQIRGETVGGIGPIPALNKFMNNVFVDTKALFDTLARMQGRKSMFSNSVDGGSTSNPGTGLIAEEIFDLLLLQSVGAKGAEKKLEKAMQDFEGATGHNFADQLLRGSESTLTYNARILKMAYMAAASAGQTGRTLSDKDLQFFLEMVGGRGNDDPVVQRKLLRNFIDDLTVEVDNSPRVVLNRRKITAQFDMTNPTIRGIVKTYNDVFEDEKGVTQYEFVPFLKRYTDKNNPSIQAYVDALKGKGVVEQLERKSTRLFTSPESIDPAVQQELQDYFNKKLQETTP